MKYIMSFLSSAIYTADPLLDEIENDTSGGSSVSMPIDWNMNAITGGDINGIDDFDDAHASAHASESTDALEFVDITDAPASAADDARASAADDARASAADDARASAADDAPASAAIAADDSE